MQELLIHPKNAGVLFKDSQDRDVIVNGERHHMVQDHNNLLPRSQCWRNCPLDADRYIGEIMQKLDPA